MSFLTEHYDDIFKKYSVAELLKDIASFQDVNGGSLEKVLNHFFKEEIFKCWNLAGKKSPMEFLENDEKVGRALAIIDRSPKFFDSDSIVLNLESFIRNQVRFTNKVANFNPRDARDIYFRYFPEYLVGGFSGQRLNILDPSAGFGSRMLAVLLSGQNYFAYEPNKSVYHQLCVCVDFLRTNGVISVDQVCDIRCLGSESFIPEWVGKMDVSFTSPPYFNLEFYSDDGCASTRNYGDYRRWLIEYVVPTVSNIQYYLKLNACAMINIKNLTDAEHLFDDWFKVFERVVKGFEFVETFNLKFRQAKRNNAKGNFEKYSEPVMSFRKVKVIDRCR